MTFEEEKLKGNKGWMATLNAALNEEKGWMWNSFWGKRKTFYHVMGGWTLFTCFENTFCWFNKSKLVKFLH